MAALLNDNFRCGATTVMDFRRYAVTDISTDVSQLAYCACNTDISLIVTLVERSAVFTRVADQATGTRICFPVAVTTDIAAVDGTEQGSAVILIPNYSSDIIFTFGFSPDDIACVPDIDE